MRWGRAAVPFLAACLVLTPGCQGGSGGGRSPGPGSSPSPQACRVLYAPPPGYLPTGVVRQSPERGGGVRESFADRHDNALHLTSGIEGEFGEGATSVETLPVAGERPATLYGGRESWVLVWQLDASRCVTQTVGADGVDRDAFMQLLRRMGVVGSGPAS